MKLHTTGQNFNSYLRALLLSILFLSTVLSGLLLAEDRPSDMAMPMDGLAAQVTRFEDENGRPPRGPAEAFGGHEPVDPWGTSYRMTVFDEMEAGRTGLDYQFQSAGPDRAFDTDDDLFWPLPDPDYEPSPIWNQIYGPAEEEESPE